jgi:hypothetical protein
VAKAKAIRPSKVRAVGLACVVGLTCAAGVYYAGKRSGKIEEKIASLISSARTPTVASQPPKPAPEMKRAEPQAVKQADKVELTHLVKIVAARKPSATSAPKTEEKEHPPLGVSLLDNKDASQPAAEGDDNRNKATLSVGFENLAGKPIRAFEGILKFTDQLDNKIYSSKIAVSKLISNGASFNWDEHLDTSKLDDTGKRLLGEDRANLKAVFEVKKVFFVDGTVKKYGMRS